MSEATWKQLEDAFAGALELGGEEREHFVARFEKEYPELGTQLRNLLRADGESDDDDHDAVGALFAEDGEYTTFTGSMFTSRDAISALLDEIGFIVTHIDDKGFVRFRPLGGFDPKTLTSQRVLIHGRKDVLGVIRF